MTVRILASVMKMCINMLILQQVYCSARLWKIIVIEVSILGDIWKLAMWIKFISLSR